MSGVTGKGSTSIKKQLVKESLIPAVGFNKIRFLHKMTAGQTSISLTSLVAPSVSEAPQYSAPNVSQLTAVNLAQFPDNIQLVSSLHGRLMRNMAFDIAGASTLTLLYPASANEIIEGIIDPVAITGNNIVDAKPIVATGTLLAGQTDFNVGEPYEVGKFPLAQHGSVLVFLDSQLLNRNTSNQAPGPGVEGDYYEVHAGAGLGTIVRLNTPDLINDRKISVVSVAALTERPNGSMMAFIENVNGKVDSMIPALAAALEVPESTFGGVSNVDLKAFGDRVLQAEADINSAETRLTALESIPDVVCIYKGGSGPVGPANSFITFTTAVRDTHAAFSGDTFTVPANKGGTYDLNINLNINGSTIAGSLVIVTPYINGVAYLPQVEVAGGASGNLYPKMTWKGLALSVDDEVKFDITTTTIGTPTYGGGADLNVMAITRTGG